MSIALENRMTELEQLVKTIGVLVYELQTEVAILKAAQQPQEEPVSQSTLTLRGSRR